MFTRFIPLVFATVLLGPPLHSHGADPDEGKPTALRGHQRRDIALRIRSSSVCILPQDAGSRPTQI